MERHEEDDVLSAVSKVFQFYNREFDDLSRQMWRSYIRERVETPEELKSALRKHCAKSKFYPKPADITEHLDNKPRFASRYDWDKPMTTDCPPDVADAWRYWLGKWWNHQVFLARDPVDDEEKERWLMIVNKEAKRTSTPEAIPDDYKLEEIWGG